MNTSGLLQTGASGVITFMMAKFILNDVPHASGMLANPDYERKPTSGQLRYIAVLCQQLKMTVVYEERVRTFGEAGLMIRELKSEREYRRGWRRVKRGKP